MSSTAHLLPPPNIYKLKNFKKPSKSRTPHLKRNQNTKGFAENQETRVKRKGDVTRVCVYEEEEDHEEES